MTWNPLGWGAVTLFWLAVGVGTGLQLHLTGGLAGGTASAADAVRVQTAHALPWIPATFAALLLAGSRPLRPAWRPGRVALHLAVACAAVVALNLLMVASRSILAPGLVPGTDVGSAVARGVLGQGHLAALAWGVLVAVGHAVHRGERSATEATAGPLSPGAGSRRDGPLLAFRDHRGTVRVPAREIRWIRAEGDYVRIHSLRGEHLVDGPFGELARHLSPLGFARIHRSTVVRLDRIRRHFPKSHGDRWVELDDGTRLVLTRGRRDPVLARLRAGRDPGIAPPATGPSGVTPPRG